MPTLPLVRECALYTEFHGLSENPFAIIPNPRLAWLGAGMRKVRAELYDAVLEGCGLMLLFGGPGVGKSLVLALLATDLKQIGASCHVHALNCGLGVGASELLDHVAEDAAGDDGATATERLTVLLIDEAQHICSAELDILLHAITASGDTVRVVLAGTPELELTVHEALAEYPATIVAHWSLEPLLPEEIGPYIVGRLQAAGGGRREIFTADAIECLIRYSGGVPRRLNVLCSTALFLAWREGREDVDGSTVKAVLPAFNATGSLTDAVEQQPLAPPSVPIHPAPNEATVLREVKDLPIAELESALLKVPVVSGSGQSEVNETTPGPAAQSESIAPERNPPEMAAYGPKVARLETCEFAVTATPASRELAQFPLKVKSVARQHRPMPALTLARVRQSATLYMPLAAVATIAFLLIATDWRAQDEQPVAVTSPPPTDPSAIATNQPIAVSVYVDPQFDEEGPQSATKGPPSPETIGSAELAELLARARQQIGAFALTTPPGDNAFETLQRVLAAMPAQPDALQGIRDIARKYALLAFQADKRGEYGLAERYLAKGLGLVPDHPDLLAVQRKLDAEASFEPHASTATDRLGIAPTQRAGNTK